MLIDLLRSGSDKYAAEERPDGIMGVIAIMIRSLYGNYIDDEEIVPSWL